MTKDNHEAIDATIERECRWLYKEAKGQKEFLSKKLKNIGEISGGRVVNYGLKNKRNIKWKLKALHYGCYKSSYIGDVLRGALIYKTVKDCYKAKKVIAKRLKITKFDDYFKEPKASGYRALHLLIFLPNKSFAEIQLHTEGLYNAVKLPTTGNYRTRMRLKAKANILLHRMAEMEKKERVLFDKQWKLEGRG